MLNYFLVQNAALSLFFGVGLFAGGVSMAVFAADYQDQIDIVFDDAADEFEQIRSSLISSTVSTFQQKWLLSLDGSNRETSKYACIRVL